MKLPKGPIAKGEDKRRSEKFWLFFPGGKNLILACNVKEHSWEVVISEQVSKVENMWKCILGVGDSMRKTIKLRFP